MTPEPTAPFELAVEPVPESEVPAEPLMGHPDDPYRCEVCGRSRTKAGKPFTNEGAVNLHKGREHPELFAEKRKEEEQAEAERPRVIVDRSPEGGPSDDVGEPGRASDNGPTFAGKDTNIARRRERLLNALQIFPLKKGDAGYILNMWENTRAVRESDRDFYDLLMELDVFTSEPRRAYRLIDMVFGDETAAPGAAPYHGRYDDGAEEPQASYYGGRGGRSSRGGGYEEAGYGRGRQRTREPGVLSEYEHRQKLDEERKRWELEKRSKELEEENVAIRQRLAAGNKPSAGVIIREQIIGKDGQPTVVEAQISVEQWMTMKMNQQPQLTADTIAQAVKAAMGNTGQSNPELAAIRVQMQSLQDQLKNKEMETLLGKVETNFTGQVNEMQRQNVSLSHQLEEVAKRAVAGQGAAPELQVAIAELNNKSALMATSMNNLHGTVSSLINMWGAANLTVPQQQAIQQQQQQQQAPTQPIAQTALDALRQKHGQGVL